MSNYTPMKLRAVRCVATGKVTRQSSNKTKRLLKLGGFVEVLSGDEEVLPEKHAPQKSRWRMVGITAGSVLCVLAVLVWLRAMYLI